MEELSKEEIWDLASLINESDGKEPSEYLKKLIEENKKDKITTKEIVELLKEKYDERNN